MHVLWFCITEACWNELAGKVESYVTFSHVYSRVHVYMMAICQRHLKGSAQPGCYQFRRKSFPLIKCLFLHLNQLPQPCCQLMCFMKASWWILCVCLIENHNYTIPTLFSRTQLRDNRCTSFSCQTQWMQFENSYALVYEIIYSKCMSHFIKLHVHRLSNRFGYRQPMHI